MFLNPHFSQWKKWDGGLMCPQLGQRQLFSLSLAITVQPLKASAGQRKARRTTRTFVLPSTYSACLRMRICLPTQSFSSSPKASSSLFEVVVFSVHVRNPNSGRARARGWKSFVRGADVPRVEPVMDYHDSEV
jgi:hypothetical protein